MDLSGARVSKMWSLTVCEVQGRETSITELISMVMMEVPLAERECGGRL